MRRLPGLCYLCGDPAVNEWFCPAHVSFSALEARPGYIANDVESVRLGRLHAYWVDRFTPDQVVELARHIETNEAAA